MNAVVERAPYELAIYESKQEFTQLAGGALTYSAEELFAMQALLKNDFVFKIANRNPNSVRMAMVNVAATGLTLNPAMGYAYLIPRDGSIVLDISYKGLIKIATDSGSIMWARADCVYETDRFTYRGPCEMPEVVADPFSKSRGEIVGAYCIAKTVDGDFLVEVMDRAAIEQVRGKSEAWKRGDVGKKGPWEEFFSEMCRKAVIKRARKTWPYTDRDDRMARAVELANQAEGGYTFEGDSPASAVEKRKLEHDIAHDKHAESIAFIKDRIAADDMKAVADEWRAIPEDDQRALWLATTKGGCFTTAERKAIKERLPPIAALPAA